MPAIQHETKEINREDGISHLRSDEFAVPVLIPEVGRNEIGDLGESTRERAPVVAIDQPVAPPFLAVRVQDELHGATVEKDGLRLPYLRTDGVAETRNTSHWSVNSIVSDHAYGKFNTSPDGSLKGKIVVIADPREMPVPAGLGQVDTWFRLDASRAADGALVRGITVGPSAVVVAPTNAPIPDGIKVVRYEGGIAERDAAVKAVMHEKGIKVEQAGMWGWTSGGNNSDWATHIAQSTYPKETIHVGSHAGSADESIESGARIGSLLKDFESNRLYARHDGTEIPMQDVIRQAIHEHRAAIETVTKAMPESEKVRVGTFYEDQLHKLQVAESRTTTIEKAWSATNPPSLPLGQQFAAMPPPLPHSQQAAAMPPPLPNSGVAAKEMPKPELSARDKAAHELLAVANKLPPMIAAAQIKAQSERPKSDLNPQAKRGRSL